MMGINWNFKRHWARDETHTLCGGNHAARRTSPKPGLFVLARSKATVSCKRCLKRLPTRYAVLMAS